MVYHDYKSMNISTLLDKAFRLSLANLKPFMKLSIIYILISLIPSLVVDFFYDNETLSPLFSNSDYNLITLVREGNWQLLSIILPIFILFGLINWLIKIYYRGMTYDLFIKAYLGEFWDMKTSLSYIGSKYGRLIMGSLIEYGLLIIGLLICGLGIFYFYIILLPFFTVILFENKTVKEAVKRSKQLIKPNFWNILASGLLIILCMIGIALFYSGIILLFDLFHRFFILSSYKLLIDIFLVVIEFFFMSVYQIIITALATTFSVLVYFNQCIRHENLGIELMVNDFLDKTQIISRAHSKSTYL